MKHDKVVSEILGDELTLSPSDLLNQQFRRARFGGYDRQQVDDYIERVADLLEGLINQIRLLKDKNDEQRRSLDEYKDLEAALRGALLSSQHHGQQMLDAARREAQLIVDEAKLKRSQAQADATKLPTTLARDINLLEQQRSRLRVEIMAILETHKRLLDSLVPEDAAAVPLGFFEVGATASLTQDSSFSFANEPVTSILEGISHTAYVSEEPELSAVDPVADTNEGNGTVPADAFVEETADGDPKE